jgi:hypothetical protein
VYATILQFLSDSPRRLGRSAGLELDNLDEIRDPTKIILVVGLTREPLDSDRDGRVWFFLL